MPKRNSAVTNNPYISTCEGGVSDCNWRRTRKRDWSQNNNRQSTFRLDKNISKAQSVSPGVVRSRENSTRHLNEI